MIKLCVICNSPVIVEGEPEIVSCSNDSCLKTVENHIGLNYQSQSVVASKNYFHRNDFQIDMMGEIRAEI